MSIIKVKTGGITADAITDALIADDVVGTEHLTANEVDTTALGADAVTAAQIADDAISEEHLDVTAITGHTAETSIADGDTLLIHDASASALRKMTKANFVSGVGGDNTPYLEVVLSTVAVTLTSGSPTKIPFNVTKHNVGGGTWDTTNYRYTPGVAGRYMVSVTASISADSNNAQMATLITVKKNGTIEHYPSGHNNRDDGQGRGSISGGTCMIDLDTDDYVEAFATNTSESSANGRIDGESTQTFMSIFKLIG